MDRIATGIDGLLQLVCIRVNRMMLLKQSCFEDNDEKFMLIGVYKTKNAPPPPPRHNSDLIVCLDERDSAHALDFSKVRAVLDRHCRWAICLCILYIMIISSGLIANVSSWPFTYFDQRMLCGIWRSGGQEGGSGGGGGIFVLQKWK